LSAKDSYSPGAQAPNPNRTNRCESNRQNEIQAVKLPGHAPPVVKTVRLGVHCPHGCTVCLAGSFNGWQPTELQRDGEERHIDLSLPPGDYEYLFVVNDRWLPDPACVEGRPNPYGGENSVLHVPPKSGPP
jgi:1,4-alpha-glucan branching enzyme